MAQYGSKIEQYANKPSALDQLYHQAGDDEATQQAARDRKQAAANNRHLRWSASHGNLQAINQLDANMSKPGYRNSGGVTSVMEDRSKDEMTGVNRTEEGLVLEASRKKRIAAELGGNPNAANALEQAAAKGGAVGASSPPAGSSATPGATTPPVAQGGAGNGTSEVNDWRTAVVDRNTKFRDDLQKYGKKDPKERTQEEADRILAYGKSIGVDENQINAAIRGEDKLDSSSAALSAQADVKRRQDAAANTPEAKAASATASFGKAYGAYMNGAGKKDDQATRDAKYAELKAKAEGEGFVVSQEAKDKVGGITQKYDGQRIESDDIEAIKSPDQVSIDNHRKTSQRLTDIESREAAFFS